MSKRFEMAKRYTEKYRHLLVPCKFCGNTEIQITSERTIFEPRNVWAATCSTRDCDFVVRKTAKEAAEAWRERHG